MNDCVCIAHAENIGHESGGTIRVASLAQSLVEADYEVHLVAPSPREGTEVPGRLSNVNIHIVPVTSRGTLDQVPRALTVSWKALRLTRSLNARLQVERATLAGFVSLLGGTDYVLDLHDIGFNGPLYRNLPLSPLVTRFVRRMERQGVKNAGKVIAVSEPMQRFVEDEWGATDTGVIHNGVRSEILRFGAERSANQTDSDVAFIGNLNHNIAYEKFCKLAEEVKGIRIHVIGDGVKRSRLEKMVQERGLNNIEIHGYLPDEQAYTRLMKAAVCIFPLRDNHHTRMAQHMKGFDYGALGKAIATDRDSTANILEENDAALVSDPANPEQLVENVQALLDDERQRKELGQRAREIAETFTWKRQGQKLVELHESFFRNTT